MKLPLDSKWSAARAAVLLIGCNWLGFGCQSIAGVEDVTFEADSALAGCDEYCASVLDSCPGDLGIYDDSATCLGVCAVFKPGNAANPVGNTLACRVQQASFAASLAVPLEKQPHCTGAGPGGGDLCAEDETLPNCDAYCMLYMSACTSISTSWGFGSLDECTRKCAAVPASETYAAGAAAESGDTLACRLYFASAATLDPDANCASAGIRPTESCLGEAKLPPSCEDYCKAVDVACTGELKVYESRKQCEAVCAKLSAGSRTDTGHQDTVGCRITHSYNALLSDPRPHCPHSGPGGDGVCSGDNDPNCKPYCRLAAAGCGEDFSKIYGDEAGCLEACRLLDDAEAGNKYSIESAETGDTLKCRMLHAARALETPTKSGQFCPAVFGASPCD